MARELRRLFGEEPTNEWLDSVFAGGEEKPAQELVWSHRRAG
jgi:hypothetical protein